MRNDEITAGRGRERSVFSRGRWSLSLVALSAALGACGDLGTGPEPDPVLRGAVVSPEARDPVVGEVVPLVVEVTLDGRPAEGVEVRWEVVDAQGALAPSQGVTGEDGRAGTTWTVGSAAGRRSIRIRAGDAEPFLFETEARAGEARTVRFEEDAVLLSARRERRLLAPRFEDVFGNRTAPPKDLSWHSSDPAVADVDGEGRVVARTEGNTTVRLVSPVGEAEMVVEVAFRGAVTVTFDDGFRSAYERGVPVMSELGLRGNVGVVVQAVEESWADFMTLEDLQELHEAGWAMVSHSVSHPDLTGLSQEEMAEELAASRSWIEAQGFRGAGVFIVPYHEWNAAVRAEVERHYEMARGRSVWMSDLGTLPEWLPADPYGLAGLDADFYRLGTASELDELRDLVRYAVEEGLLLEIFFHRVEEEDEDRFRRIMEVVAEFRGDVVTLDEALDRLLAPGEAHSVVQ
jgi:peptidoglycan/xylan/chitin deacetylase (PgdA/CDA1 family)